MSPLRRMLLQVFLVIELFVFAWVYLFGTHGLYALVRVEQQNKLLEQELVDIRGELTELEQERERWESDSFYKEKIAREQLQLARKGDQLYYFKN